MKRNVLFLFMLVLISVIGVIVPEICAALQPDVAGDLAVVSGAEAVLHLENYDSVPQMAAGAAFAALKWNVGQNNMGGYKGHLLFIPEDAVSAAPVVPEPGKATDNKDLVTAKGSFTFATGSALKTPVYLYSTDGEVGFSSKPQGETDGISYKQELVFLFPGSTPEMHAFSTMIKNTRGYFVFEDVDGVQYLMGQPGLTASCSPDFDGGKKRSDRRGTTYRATCDSNYSAIIMGTPIDIRKAGGYDTPVAVSLP